MATRSKKAKILEFSNKANTKEAEPALVVDLDLERQECMLRNQQRLQQLGLLPALKSIRETIQEESAARKPNTRKRPVNIGDVNGGEDQTLRRSRRARGQQPDLPPLLVPMFTRPSEAEQYSKPLPEVQRHVPTGPTLGGDTSKFDAHNLHRLRTMSDEAMLKRINKITNTLKLKSLVQMLRDFGRDELADEAQAALDELLACVR